MNLYKETAINLYIETIKELVPEIEDSELNRLKYAFGAGFNMGLVDSESDEVKELALKMMVR